MSIFAGSNLYSVSLPGTLLGTGTTLAYTTEPTGLGYDADGIVDVNDLVRVILAWGPC